MKTMKIYDHQPAVKRMSKKGKVARLAMTILLAFGIGVYAGTGIGNIGQGPTVVADEADVHVVEDGETLWDIARSVADARGQDIRETIYEIKINNGLSEDDNLQPGQAIDVMSVDVEGFDFNVLKSNDWGRFKPKIILVELQSKNIPEVVDSEINKYLSSFGYILYSKLVHTAIFIQPEFAELNS